MWFELSNSCFQRTDFYLCKFLHNVVIKLNSRVNASVFVNKIFNPKSETKSLTCPKIIMV